MTGDEFANHVAEMSPPERDRFKSGTNTGQAQPTKLVALPHPRRAEAGDKTVIAGTVNPTVPRRVISSTSMSEWLGFSPPTPNE